MPFSKRKRGNKIEVINSETGDVKGTHETEAEADKQLAALHANNADKDRKDKAHMDIVTKAVSATITDTSANADQYPGTFEVELTNESLDRDGDVLKGDEWELPLPQQITFVNDHTHKMASVVGSATPSLENGKIICRGTWAETDNAQQTRKVIKHVPYVSVAFREKRNRKAGTVSRELINGSFVVIPSNPNAKVLSSKGFGLDDGELTEEAQTLIERVVKTVLKSSGVAYVDESLGGNTLPAGFTATTLMDTTLPGEQVLEIKDASGKVILAHKFSAPEAPNSADLSADREKGLTPQMRARAMALSTRHEID